MRVYFRLPPGSLASHAASARSPPCAAFTSPHMPAVLSRALPCPVPARSELRQVRLQRRGLHLVQAWLWLQPQGHR